MDYSLKEAAELLGIAPATLRRWNERFDALLSESARQAYMVGGSTAPGRHTEADIAILQRAKTLIWSGRSYDQTLHELTGNQSSEPSDDHIAKHPQSRASSNYITRPLPTVQGVDKQPIQHDTGRIGTLDRAQQGQQSQIDHLHEEVEQLHTENEELSGYRESWRERFSRRLFFQIAIVTAICAVAIFVAIGIVWLGNPRALVGADEAPIAPTAFSISAATHVANSRLASPLPRAITPTIQPATTNTPAGPAAVASSPQPLLTTDPFPTASPIEAASVPRAGPVSAEALLLQVAEAEAALRMGQIEATITYGARPRSSAQVRFDLGDEQRVPSFQITTAYEGGTNAQTAERITIGDQAWERQQGGQWTVMPARESALKQLQVFLPRTDSIPDLQRVTVERAIAEDTYVLRWYDTARDADVALLVDAAGLPQQLRRVSRANGLILTVTYKGWNTAVEISRPE